MLLPKSISCLTGKMGTVQGFRGWAEHKLKANGGSKTVTSGEKGTGCHDEKAFIE